MLSYCNSKLLGFCCRKDRCNIPHARNNPYLTSVLSSNFRLPQFFPILAPGETMSLLRPLYFGATAIYFTARHPSCLNKFKRLIKPDHHLSTSIEVILMAEGLQYGAYETCDDLWASQNANLLKLSWPNSLSIWH